MTPVDLASIVAPEQVIILDEPGLDRAAVIARLAPLALGSRPEVRLDTFIEALLRREQVTSTAMGGSVAVPHARLDGLAVCRLALGVVPRGIAWDAPDQLPVRVVALLAVRECDHGEHLRLLATLALRLRDQRRIEAIVEAREAVAARSALLA